MPLPLPPNTTCDIYRGGAGPPDPPSVAGVVCHLQAALLDAPMAGPAAESPLRFTHRMLVALNTDIRDRYDAGSALGLADQVYIPDRAGTAFKVVFVDRPYRGTSYDVKRVFLDRRVPTWPSEQL
jgi:hypothetical protein